MKQESFHTQDENRDGTEEKKILLQEAALRGMAIEEVETDLHEMKELLAGSEEKLDKSESSRKISEYNAFVSPEISEKYAKSAEQFREMLENLREDITETSCLLVALKEEYREFKSALARGKDSTIH